MRKIFRSKKGFNDMFILSGLITIFTAIGFVLPFIQVEFSDESNELDIDNIADDTKDSIENADKISGFDVLLSILKMFIWTFGDIPTWLDLMVFVPLRLLAYALVGRNLWVGGGA